MAIQSKLAPTAVAAICFFGLLGCSVTAQTSGSAAGPSTSTVTATNAATVQLGQSEAAQRSQVDPAGFFTDFSKLANTGGDFGDARYALGQVAPALFTLPGEGISQGIVTLGPCALFSPHYHPRGSEAIYVSQGNVNVSFVEENAVTVNGVQYGGGILNYTMPSGSSVVIPQGLMHFIYNPTCANATLVTSFASSDPGTVSIVQNLFRLDTSIIQAATGLQGQFQDAVRAIVNKGSIIGQDPTCAASCASPSKSSSSSSSG